MANVLEALAFAARNLWIFPLPYGEKRPTDSFLELATNDPEKIKLLWRDPITGSKELNIGVLCGSGGNRLIIIDIDTKYDTRFHCSAIANYTAIGGHFDTLVIKTASGGLQAYFWLPEGVTFRNMQGVVLNVDIRCENGYGIGPGSFSLASGGAYEIYVDKPITELPHAIVPLLKPWQERKVRLNGHADSEKAIPLFVDYLQRVEPAIEGQGGDTHTYNVACMGVRDYGLSEPTTTLLMLEHFNPRCIPPWDADELKHKVENAEQYAIGETGSRDPDKVLDGVEYKAPTTPALIYPQDTSTDDTLLEPGHIPLTEWLVYPLLIKRKVTTLIGPGGVGKSSWAIALACHAVVGRDFGPFTVRQAFEIAIFSPEDDRGMISGRAEVACDVYRIDNGKVRERVRVYSEDRKPIYLVEMHERKMRVPQETVEFLARLKAKHPHLQAMFFDPLRKFLRGGINENDNSHMSEVMGHINAIAFSLDVAILLSHHTAKNLFKQKDLDPDSPDISVGAGAVSSSARLVINVLPQLPSDIMAHGRQDNYFSTRLAKNSYGPTGYVTWWQRQPARASNGQEYVTPVPVDVKNAMAVVNSSYVATIGDHMLEHHVNTLTVTQAAIVITDNNPFNDRSVKSMGETLRLLFHRGTVSHSYVSPAGQRYTLSLETEGKSHMFTLTEMPGAMPGALQPAMVLAKPEETET